MRIGVVLLGIAAAAPPAWSMDLLDTWRAAASHDAEYAAAQSSRAAGAALAREASALWRATVGLEAGIGWAPPKTPRAARSSRRRPSALPAA